MGKKSLTPDGIVALTWATIALNMAIAFALASLSYRQDIQYFVLMVAPILQAAFRLSLSATLLAVTASASLIFFWVWNYFRIHPPADFNEYIEAGTISLIYAVAGLLVWALVNHLRSKQTDLAKSLIELEQAKERLLVEEKLAAVGRFSSAIAHEIRNPVAMISSALSTALNRGPSSTEGQEMFEIAAKEASRLERLTTDFLSYARPRSPSKERGDVSDSIGYIADICRARATELAVTIRTEGEEGLWADIDGGQLQQALLNLAMNAIEASPSGATVVLRGRRANGRIWIEVENGHGPSPRHFQWDASSSRSLPPSRPGRVWGWPLPATSCSGWEAIWSCLAIRLTWFSSRSFFRLTPERRSSREQNPDCRRRTQYAQDSGVESGSG